MDEVTEQVQALAMRQYLELMAEREKIIRRVYEEGTLPAIEYTIVTCSGGTQGVLNSLDEQGYEFLAWLPDIAPSATALVRRRG